MTTTILSSLDFTLAAAEALRAVPTVQLVGFDTLELYLQYEGREIQTQLNNFYDIYRAQPESLPTILAALRDTLTNLPPDRFTTDVTALLPRLLPMLKPLAMLSEVREQGVPMLVYRPFLGDLMITYVVDEGASVAYVNENHLSAWQLDAGALHTRALANLAARATPLEIVGSGARALAVSASTDGYSATRLLLPGLFAEFQAGLEGDLVIGIPNRDFLIAFGDDDPLLLERLRIQIATDATTKPYPLTALLFTIRNGTVELYH